VPSGEHLWRSFRSRSIKVGARTLAKSASHDGGRHNGDGWRWLRLEEGEELGSNTLWSGVRGGRIPLDELDEPRTRAEIASMPSTARSDAVRKSTGSARSGALVRKAARVEVPPGLSAEEARRVLASGAGTVARTGRPLTLDLKTAAGKGAARFVLVRSRRAVAALPRDVTPEEAVPLSPSAPRAALRRAYARGEETAAEHLLGPGMLPSDAIAGRLGLSREAVHQKRRRGELLGLEGAKCGVRFPAWQLGPDDLPLPALRDLHDALGEPWAVFRFLRQRHPELGMRTGLEAAADPRRAGEAVALARGVGAYGPAGA
jgi:hypothetical protein